MASTSHSPSDPGPVSEFSVRIPKKAAKKYSVMQFNRQTKVDFRDFSQVKMERENNLKEFKATVGEEMPTFGAGSEFGRERREEARRKKFGFKTQNYKEEDQPWILKLGGKQGKGKRFKGRKEGLVAENACYYILKQLPDHSFEAHPVDSFYNFAPMINYRTLNAEEAEEEFGKRDRTVNYFNMMLQRKLKDQPEEGEQGEKQKKEVKKAGLTITEDDEFQDLLMSDNEDSDDDIDSKAKGKKKGKKDQKPGKVKKKKKVEEDEALEESDEGDFDERELDYISEESSEGEAEIEEKNDIKGIDQELQKIEDEEEEKAENEAAEEEEEAAKEEGELDKKGSDSESERSDSSESDIDDQMQSPFLMQKKSGKKSSNKSSSRSSTGPSSRSNTPTPSDTTKTLADAASKLQKESGEKMGSKDKVKKPERPPSRPSEKADSKKVKTENGEHRFQAIKRPHSATMYDQPGSKKMRTDSPVPRSQTGTPPSEHGITEDVVRRYLTRKPMQTKDLLYKLNPKKVGLSKEEVVKRLTEVLKRLNPDKIKIKDKTYWTIKVPGQKVVGV